MFKIGNGGGQDDIFSHPPDQQGWILMINNPSSQDSWWHMILGLDLGSLQTGWALVRLNGARGYEVKSSGTFIEKEKKGVSFDLRCFTMGQYISSILELNPSIHSICIEDVFVGKNPRTIIKLGHLRGVISHLCIEIAGLEPIYINTRTIKKLIGSSGLATKDQVKLMIKTLTGVEPQTLDESDAIATAIAGYHHQREAKYGGKD